MSRHTRIFAAVCIAAIIAPLGSAFAQESATKLEDEEPLEASASEETPKGPQASATQQGGPVVRRLLLYRSTRFELAPHVGFTLADTYTRNLFVGGTGTFHLTNSIGIGVSGGYAPLHPETSLRRNVADARGSDTETLDYTVLNWIADVEGTYVPVFGKFSFLNKFELNYDVHVLFGAGFIGRRGENESTGEPSTNQALDGSTVAPMWGFGARMFASDGISLNVQVRNFVFSYAEVNSGSPQPELRNRPMVTVGASFFFPGEVKVSR